MNVNHFGINAVCGQFLCCFQTIGYQKSGCNNRYILTFTKYNTFAKFKFIIRFIVNYRHSQTSKTKITWTVMLIGSTNGCFCFYIIRWNNYCHTGNRTHQCNIFITLVCRTIFTYGNTGMCCADFHIQMRITNGVTNLLKCTSCSKHRKRTCKWNFTCRCQSCRNSHHVTLSDTTVNMAFRESLFENTGLCGSRKVCIQYNKVIKFCAKFC